MVYVAEKMVIMFVSRNRPDIARPGNIRAGRARRASMPVAVLVAALTLAVPIVAGCSGGSSHHAADKTPKRSRSAGPDRTIVAWVGKVCAADASVQGLAATDVPYTSDPTRSEVRAFIKNIDRQLRVGVATFEAIGHAPVAGGDDVVAAYIRGLKSASRRVTDAGSYVRGGAPMMVGGANLPLLYVSMAVETLAPKGADLPSLVSRNPALAQAFRAAPACRESRPLTAQSATSTPSR